MSKIFINQWIESRDEDVEQWAQARKSILLAAPTGSGKTSFIINGLAEKCHEKDWTMAFFVNRKALKRQVVRNVREFMLKNNYYSCPIRVFTYQELEASNDQRADILSYLQGCAYVVLDEVHYFASDSLFSPETEVSFVELMNLIGKKCLIMMSATSGGFQSILDEYLKEQNKENYRRWKDSYDECLDRFTDYMASDHEIGLVDRTEIREEFGTMVFDVDMLSYEPDPKPKILEYEVMEIGQPDYSYVNLNYYDASEDLINIIINSNPKEKWLVFVDSCSEGRSLKEEIKDAFEEDDMRTVEFVSSKQDESSTLEYVIENITSKENLPVSILITTSVLDNGVTIKDSRLKNIVIPAFDESEFKQMLGRRRIKEGEEIQLYVSKGSVSHFKKQKNRLFDEFCSVYPILGKTPYGIEKAIVEDKVDWKGIGNYAYRYNGHPAFGWLSYRQHSSRYRELDEIAKEMEKDPQYYAWQVCRWLGKDYDSEAYIYKGMTEEELYKYALEELKKMDFIVSRDELAGFTQKIAEITGKKLNADVESINEFLAKHMLTHDYQLEAVQLNKSKYYFVIVNGGNPCRVSDQFSNLEKLQELLQEKPVDDANGLYSILFGRNIPECVSEEIYTQFISACLNKNTGFEEVALRKGRQGYQLYGGKKSKQQIAGS